MKNEMHDQAKIDEIMRYTYDSFSSDCPTSEREIEVAMKAYAEHMDRWRVVADGELPELYQEVDIIRGGVRLIDMRFKLTSDGYVFFRDSGLGIHISDVTHWKPIDLPEID